MDANVKTLDLYASCVTRAYRYVDTVAGFLFLPEKKKKKRKGRKEDRKRINRYGDVYEFGL